MTSAIIYIRFSTLQQGGGSSITRQRTDCEALCSRNGWTVEAELIDEGKSAFTGKNRDETASLGQFEVEASAGLHTGKVLVVEKLDRFSREGIEAGLGLLTGLLQGGVSVATADGSFFRAGQKLEIDNGIRALIAYDLARTESENKSKRVRAGKADALRRAHEEGRTITKTTPPWIIADKHTRKLIESIAEIVRQIFKLADMGFGRTRIVRWLHDHGIPPISNRASDGWHESYITRLLTNRAVLGEFTSRSGEPVMGYYPAIVDAALFERVNGAAPSRKKAMGGRNDPKLSNLFSGLIKCPTCGGPARYRMRQAEGTARMVNGKAYTRRRPDAYLTCSNGERHGGCENRAKVSYASLETGVLDALLHLALDDEAFTNRGEVGRVGNLIAERKRELELATTRAGKLWSAWADDASPMAKKLAQEAEGSAAAIATNIEALERQLADARGRADNAAHLRRVADVRAKLYDLDLSVRAPLRMKVQHALSTLIEKVECSETGTAVHLNASAGLLLFDRRGKLRMGFDLVHDGRKQPVQLADYLRRRGDAKQTGALFGKVA